MGSAAVRLPGLQSRGLDRLGIPGVVALGLLACGAAFYLGSLAPMRADAARLASLQARLQSARDGSANDAQRAQPEAQLAEFYGQLLPKEELELVPQRIFAVAQRFGVDLKLGSYRLVGDEADGRLARYEAVFQAQAPYYRVRLMLRGLLGEMRYIALDEISFQRQQSTNPLAEVTMKVSVYVRRG